MQQISHGSTHGPTNLSLVTFTYVAGMLVTAASWRMCYTLELGGWACLRKVLTLLGSWTVVLGQ